MLETEIWKVPLLSKTHLYLCNGKKCKCCDYPNCYLTKDINYSTDNKNRITLYRWPIWRNPIKIDMANVKYKSFKEKRKNFAIGAAFLNHIDISNELFKGGDMIKYDIRTS